MECWLSVCIVQSPQGVYDHRTDVPHHPFHIISDRRNSAASLGQEGSHGTESYSHPIFRTFWCCVPAVWGTHLCNLCVDTRWLAHVLRDRPDGSHGAGGLLQVGGPVADALWLQVFGVALLTLCLFVGGKQKKQTNITISTRKKNEHSVPSSPRVHRTVTHTVLRVQPHPFANLAQVPLFPAPYESVVSVGSSDVVGSGPDNVNIEGVSITGCTLPKN